MNPVFLITLSGPIFGAGGYFLELPWLLWVGVALCLVNLFMNLTSGVMKLPVLPTIAVIIGVTVVSPWYLGAGYGLLIYTATEAAGEVVGRGATPP